VELLLIRHGLPVRIDDAGGPADPALSEEGREQARRLAGWYGDGTEPIDAVYTSPLLRARQTAEPLAEATGHQVVVDDELAEFDRGFHFYVPLEELKAAGDPRYKEIMSGTWETGEEVEVDPETFRQVVVGAVERVIAGNPGGRVAVVCHGGVVNAYASHVLGIPSILFFNPGYTSVSRILAARSGERSILSLNEMGHLRQYPASA
jgi:2,3-bisphosphoglycerate-dependent phosphoglycerate mutase